MARAPVTADAVLPLAALDERIAIVGTSGSGKTYMAKGGVERLLAASARVCIVDPLGVWWGLRADAAGTGPGYPVVVFGGHHADVALGDGMGGALGHVVGTQALGCVVDLSELGSGAARRRFMLAFAESLYEANSEPLHLVLDEADLWAPQRPLPDANALLGRIEEIVRRGRVRGFIPWLITQRPAVVHKDVLSQADILVMMKLTSSQDRDAVGGWIEGQADRAEGKRILADLPKLGRGEGYVWAPGRDTLARVAFPAISTFDSSRTPRRGERLATPGTLAKVDLSAITAALAVAVPTADDGKRGAGGGTAQLTMLQGQLTQAEAHIAALQAENGALHGRIRQIAALAAAPGPAPPPAPATKPPAPPPAPGRSAITAATGALHPAAQKLLTALAQHAPARFTWGQVGMLAGLKAAGGHFNAGRKELRTRGLVDEAADLVVANPAGLDAAGVVPPAPSTLAERLELWCQRLPSPAPEMLRYLAAHGTRFLDTAQLAAAIGKKPTGGHWNSGLALLRNNGLVEVKGKQIRAAALLR